MKEKLINLLENSYSPYSKYQVSAILVTKDNKEFSGVNVEDATTRAGTCAERNAIFNAITNGYKKNDFKEINIMVSSGKIGMPCFVCRQMMLEMFELNTIIRCYSTNGEYVEHTLEELCQYPFDGEDLK